MERIENIDVMIRAAWSLDFMIPIMRTALSYQLPLL